MQTRGVGRSREGKGAGFSSDLPQYRSLGEPLKGYIRELLKGGTGGLLKGGKNLWTKYNR